MDHMFDAGYPLLTEKFIMEHILKKDEVIEKIENSLISPTKSRKIESVEKFVETMSDIREENWYTPNASTNDEILFDIVEYLDCVMEK